jgi:phosphatidylserine decarboxylase
MAYNIILLSIIILVLFILWFHRHPLNTRVFSNDDVIYSPAYGKIMKIQYLQGNKLHIAIYLSPKDIHRQYIPIDGTIIDKIYDRTGKFALAYNVNKSALNEKYITVLKSKYGNIEIYQIAGKLVRRISNYMKVGQTVTTGEEIGIIHFGSRVDIILPNISLFKLLVKEGEYMCGMDSKLGYYVK